MGTFFVLCVILCKLVFCRSDDFNLNEKEKEDVKCVVEKLYQSNKELFEKLADFIIKQGESSNVVNVDIKQERNNSNNDGKITNILSNMTDKQLISLLRRSPNKEVFTAQDLISALHGESSGEKQAPAKGNVTKALLPTLDSKYYNSSSTVNIQRNQNEINKTLDVDGAFKNIHEPQKAIPINKTAEVNKTKSLDEVEKLFTNVHRKQHVPHSSQLSIEDSAEMSDESHNKLVDDLLTKLRNICHHSRHMKSKRKKKVKRIVLTVDEDIDSAEFVKLFKRKVNQKREDLKADQEGENKLMGVLKQLSNSQEKRGWQMFLIFNEDLDANAMEGIISVDPDSLSENSTVLPLGVLQHNISHNELIEMMQTLTIELKQDSHQKVLKQLSNGEIKLNTTDPFRTLISRSYARRFIKPEICNYQYRWTKLNNSTKWIICAGNVIEPEFDKTQI